MTAKEMFEELGYVIKTKTEYEIRYCNNHGYNHEDGIDYVYFDLHDKAVERYDVYDGYRTYSSLPKVYEQEPKLYKAITQQMKELGWLE